jgi:hypothetical protein
VHAGGWSFRVPAQKHIRMQNRGSKIVVPRNKGSGHKLQAIASLSVLVMRQDHLPRRPHQLHRQYIGSRQPAIGTSHSTCRRASPGRMLRIMLLQAQAANYSQVQPASPHRHHPSTRRHPQGQGARSQFCAPSQCLFLHWCAMQGLQ